MNQVDLYKQSLRIEDEIAENAKNKEYWRIKEKLAQNLIDGLSI